MLTWLARKGTPFFASAMVFLALMIAANTVMLVLAADLQATREATSQERIQDALDAVIQAPTDPTLLSAMADPQWSPDVLGSDLLWLYEAGQLLPNGH